MFVGEAACFERWLELGGEQFGEDVFEAAVIGLENGVLGRQIDRHIAMERIVERGPRKVANRVVEVEHAERHAGTLELMHHMFDACAVSAGKGDGELAFAGHPEIGGAIDVAESMTADHDRLGPPGHQPRDVLADDRLAEDDAAENVADGAVRRLPHLLEAELLHPRFVRRDRGAFDPDPAGLDGMGGLDCDPVLGQVAIVDAEIEVEQGEVEIRNEQLLLDQLPNDPRHLVPVEVGDRVLHFDLVHLPNLRRGKEGGGGNKSNAHPTPLRTTRPL